MFVALITRKNLKTKNKMEILPSAVGAGSSNAPAVVAPVLSANNAPNVFIPGNVEMSPVPNSMTQTIASATGGGALTKTVYFGNEAFYNATPTDNGSGANSITNTYGDGWSGKGYTNLMNAGRGVKCYGFTLEYITTSTGAQLASGLTNANPTLLVSNMVGASQIPVGYPLAGGTRNTQYLAGTMTLQTQFVMNYATQFSYVVPAGATATLVILTASL